MVSLGWALIGLGAAVLVVWMLWGLYWRLHRRWVRVRDKMKTHGPGVLATRRNAIRTAVAAIGTGVGIQFALGGRPVSLPDGVPNASAVESGVLGLLDRTPTGQRRFSLGAGGYEYAEWTENGALRISFHDDPPMQEWYLVGPEPERELLASGTPPTFGGTETVSLEYPIQPGEYLLTGAKVRAAPDSFAGLEAERTGTARFTVEPDVWLGGVKQAGENAQQAALTVRNVGSCPVVLEGVKFGDAVPGTGTRQFLFFVEGSRRLIPTETATVVSETHPFQDGDGARMPEAFEVGLWAAEQPFWFKYDAGEVRRLETTPTAG